MNNLEYLFSFNQRTQSKSDKIKFSRSKRFIIVLYDDVFDGEAFRKLVFKFQPYMKQAFKKGSFLIVLHCRKVVDKLTYTMFECLCYYLIRKHEFEIEICWNPKRTIQVDGLFKSSPLRLLSINSMNKVKRRKKIQESNQKFINLFGFDTQPNHYRILLKYADSLRDGALISKKYCDIDSTLLHSNIPSHVGDKISEVIIELITNSIEHAKSDCLVDIDISDSNYYKKGNENIKHKSYYSINISLLNLSDNLLTDDLKKRFCQDHVPDNQRYKDVAIAYDNHQHFFNQEYTEDHFWMLVAMQNKISGSKEIDGGTGLALLVKSLQHWSDADNCYVVSGTKGLKYIKKYLGNSDDKWWGFNENNNFVSDKPNTSVYFDCAINLIGTAYNLTFIYCKDDKNSVEDDNDENN